MTKIEFIKAGLGIVATRIGSEHDLTDIGSLIGEEIGLAIQNEHEQGFTLEDFIDGIKHGYSLTNGEH